MVLDKQIEEQIKRVETLQKDLIGRDLKKEDAKRPAELKKQRATGVREAIARLQTEKKAAIARYDAEIKALEVELKTLEKRTDIDLAIQQGGGLQRRTPKGKKTGVTPTRKRTKKS